MQRSTKFTVTVAALALAAFVTSFTAYPAGLSSVAEATDDRPAVDAVNEVTNVASANAATVTVNLVERCMDQAPGEFEKVVLRRRSSARFPNQHIVMDTA